MKRIGMKMMLSLLAIGLLAVGFPQRALAAGTACDTPITNTASINYMVGGITQDTEDSDFTFNVDNKVNLTIGIRDNNAVSVTPGSKYSDSKYNVLTFRVINTGNMTQDYHLSVITVPEGNPAHFSGNDTINMEPSATLNSRIYVNSAKDVDGTFEEGVDKLDFIDELKADHYVDVFVVLDTPLAAVNGDIASYHLVATTHDSEYFGGLSGTLGPETSEDKLSSWDSANVQVVFADGSGTAGDANDIDKDGKFSNQNDYIVSSANLTISKTMEVVSDPFSSSNPKAIPGAIIRYTIQVTNTGNRIAESVILEDEILTPTIYVPHSIFLNDTPVNDTAYNDTTKKITVNIPNIETSGSAATAKVTFNVTIPE